MSTIGPCAVCQTPAHRKCARCHSVYYCGQKHQKEDWANHKESSCLAYKVKYDGDGRSLVIATRDIEEGEIIIIEPPLVLGIQDNSCVGCFQEEYKKKFTQCRRCKWPVCDRRCPGLRNLDFHGAECKILETIQSAIVSTYPLEALFPLRCLILQKSDPKKWEVVENIARLTDYLPVERCKGERRFFLEDIILKTLTKKAPHLLPEKYCSQTLERICSLPESYGILLKLPPAGEFVGVFAVTSLMKHSCMPNTRRAFEAPSLEDEIQEKPCRLIVRAAKNISKGENLTTIFLDYRNSTLQRQRHLLSFKNDRCSCERCLDPRELGTDLGTLKCLVCSGWVLPVDTSDILESDWRCEKCGVGFNNHYIAALIQSFKDEMKSLQSCKPKVSQWIRFWTKLEKHVHPHHMFCLPKYFGEIESFLANPGSIMRLDEVQLHSMADTYRDMLTVVLNRCMVDHSHDLISNTLLALSLTNLQIMKRMLASRTLDSDQAKLIKKYCSELKILSSRICVSDFSQSDVQTLQGNDVRLSPF